MTGLLRRFLNLNRTASRNIDRLFDVSYTLDGGADFRAAVVPLLVRDQMRIYDVGGGSRPCFSVKDKESRGLTIIGLDISGEELGGAPIGSYDECVVTDLCSYRGDRDGDLVICQAALEHVQDARGAIAGIASALKPSGKAAIFMPCRNAVFARLNLILPESWKRLLLFGLFPGKAKGHDGFEAHYDQCTPTRMTYLAVSSGLHVLNKRTYWTSSYLRTIFPVFVLWRCWTLFARIVFGDDMCETFVLVLEKPADQSN